jgi:N,N'-diacetyllegionaminate synthase
MLDHTLIIAEAGVNHNGDLSLAKQLIHAAKESGADFVKFQSFRAAELTTHSAPQCEYQVANTGQAEAQQEMLRRLELTPEMHQALKAECQARGIGFLSTPFDIGSMDYLVAEGVPFLKIPSGEITNLPYLRHAGRLNMPTIMSTGMATLGEVEAALELLVASGMERGRITLLHCTTEYPARFADVNLRAMLSMRKAFGVAVGYSDHTLGFEVAVAAVALGASVIEKHFTLDRNLPGPDHKASLEPSELVAMVSAIRNVEHALGDGIKRPTLSEEKNKLIVRKSIVASRPIQTGEAFCEQNLACKRPGFGVSPMQYDQVLGRRAIRNYLPDELIEL